MTHHNTTGDAELALTPFRGQVGLRVVLPLLLGGLLAWIALPANVSARPQGADASPGGKPAARDDGPRGAGPVLWQEDFSGQMNWVVPSGQGKDEVRQVFRVGRNQRDGVFLRARHDARGSDPPGAIHYGRAFQRSPIPLEQVSALRWRWRVLQHPDVGDDPWEDVAASIYVIMEKPSALSSGKGLKLGWLARPGPEGTKQRGILQVPVRVGGPLGKWQQEQVDLCALYAKEYGSCKGAKIVYIGVVTDADNTDSRAVADYAGLQLVGRPGSRR